MENTVLIFATPEVERETYVSAMYFDLLDQWERNMAYINAAIVLRRKGWSALEIATYGEQAFSKCEVFNSKHVDNLASCP